MAHFDEMSGCCVQTELEGGWGESGDDTRLVKLR